MSEPPTHNSKEARGAIFGNLNFEFYPFFFRLFLALKFVTIKSP